MALIHAKQASALLAPVPRLHSWHRRARARHRPSTGDDLGELLAETDEPLLDFLVTKAKVVHPSGGIADLRFEATDTDWCSGSGSTVTGPAQALAMSLSGRHAAPDGLQGGGCSKFRPRF